MTANNNGLNNEIVLASNRSTALGMIIRDKIVTRKDLVEQTGLGKPAVTKIINELLEAGIIVECTKEKISGERKMKGLMLSPSNVRVLSVRWMREEYKASLFDLQGTCVDTIRCDVDAAMPIENTLHNILELTDRMLEKHDRNSILGMCVGVPGPYIRTHKGNRAVVSDYERLQQIDIQRCFEEHYEFTVLTEQDAHLSAFCEWVSLQKPEREDCDCLLGLQSIGAGIGAGIILNGHIMEGAFGVAGELGQMGIYFNGPENTYGGKGTLEYYAASGSVLRYISERKCEFPKSELTEESSYQEILQEYYAEDPLALWAFDILAWRLAYGLVSTVFLINPRKIVIGPDYPVDKRFLGVIRSTMSSMMSSEVASLVEISYSTLQEDTTLLGGLYYVIDRFVNDHTLYERIRKCCIPNS